MTVEELVKQGRISEAIKLAHETGVENAAQIITEGIMNWPPIPNFLNVRTERRTTL